MLWLSDELRQPVRDGAGRKLGMLVDLTIRLEDDPPTVRRLVVRGTGGVRTLIGWATVASFEHDEVLLTSDSTSHAIEVDRGEPLPLDPDELCLARDVLDTQIVDVRGHHVVRVGDVLLERLVDDELRVVAVDVGFGSVVDRLGLHGLAHRFDERAVPWAELHLLSRRGHQVQLVSKGAPIHRLDGAELARLLARLSPSAAGEVLHASSVERGSAALHAATDEVGGRLLSSVSEDQATALLEALPAERAEHYRRLLSRTAVPARRFRRLRARRRHARDEAS